MYRFWNMMLVQTDDMNTTDNLCNKKLLGTCVEFVGQLPLDCAKVHNSFAGMAGVRLGELARIRKNKQEFAGMI